VPWVKIDDAFFTDEAVMAAGADGRLLFIAGLCHASRNLTDGAIKKAALPAIAALAGADPAAADLLVELGLWVEEGPIYRAPRYLDFNPPAEKVRAEREQAKKRMAARRSGEVQPNTDGSSASPVPSPSRPPESSSSSSSVTQEDDDVPNEVWVELARKKANTSPKPVADFAKWSARVIANDKLEHGKRARELWSMFDTTPARIADALLAGDSRSLTHEPRRQSA
jgi:hypothetical protein